MSEHAPATLETAPPTWMQRNHFLLRRLHSLTGIVPVGVFVIMHLFTNFQMLVGDFQHEVEFIHSLPALLFTEIVLWGSIAFHAGLGLVYTFQNSQPNTIRYPHQDNWRYTLQRITGILALIFIFLHVATLRWRWDFFGWYTPFYVAAPDGTPLVAATTAQALQHSIPVLILYIIGVGSVVFHWSNGLWTSAITWGLTITQSAQRRWGYACLALGIILTVFSAGAIGGALRFDLTPYAAQIQAADEQYQSTGELMHRHDPDLPPPAVTEEKAKEKQRQAQPPH